jgi:hypothetical protein
MEDPRIHHLRELIEQAVAIRDETQRLIADIASHLHESRSEADERLPRERRRKPRERKA